MDGATCAASEWPNCARPWAPTDMLQLAGMDVDKNAVQRIECGKRFVTDIELKILAQVLGVTVEDLLG